MLLTEAPGQLLEHTPAYKAALESGVTIDVTQGYSNLANRGYRAAKSISIAPSPSEAELIAKGMSEVTLPGGEIFVAAP